MHKFVIILTFFIVFSLRALYSESRDSHKSQEPNKLLESKKPQESHVQQDSQEKENYNVVLMFDKLKFFRGEPVLLKMSIKNVSASGVSFDIWEKSNSPQPEYITFQPVVFDMNGNEAEIITPYRLENRGLEEVIQGYSRRKIELGSGEEFVQTIDLTKVYRLQPDKKYRVKGYFFPYYVQNIVLNSSNILAFTYSGESRNPERYFAGEIRHEISPSEVVLLALDSEKNRNWVKMLKYFDLEKFINSYPEYERIYNSADEIERKNIINNFVRFLSRDRHDYLLDYRSFRDEYDYENKLAFVTVVVDRFGPEKKDSYEYRYTLEKYRNFWLIVNLEVNNIKGLE